MNTVIRVFASLLGSSFELSDDNTVVCTKAVSGQAVSTIDPNVDPLSLVGAAGQAAQAVQIAAGESFKFRTPNPIVVKDNGAALAYLVRS